MLKKKIYELEGTVSGHRTTGSHERSALLGGLGQRSVPSNEKFVPLLDRELHKIVTFYKIQEQELADEIDELAASIARKEEEGEGGSDPRFSDDGDSEDDELYGELSLSRSASRPRRKRSISGGSPVARRRSIGE